MPLDHATLWPMASCFHLSPKQNLPFVGVPEGTGGTNHSSSHKLNSQSKQNVCEKKEIMDEGRRHNNMMINIWGIEIENADQIENNLDK